MEMVDYNTDDFNSRYQADRGVHARFYTVPVEDRAASAEAGRPMFKDQEFIEIIAAGNQNNIVRRKASNEDRSRFSRQYEMYRRGVEDQLVGTPLAEVAWLTRSQVEELAYLRIRTLESLADLDDAVCTRHAGLYDLKAKAGAALDQAKGMAPLTALQEENEKLRNQVQTLENQVKQLQKTAKQ